MMVMVVAQVEGRLADEILTSLSVEEKAVHESLQGVQKGPRMKRTRPWHRRATF